MKAGKTHFFSGLTSCLLTETMDRIDYLGTLLLLEKSDFEYAQSLAIIIGKVRL